MRTGFKVVVFTDAVTSSSDLVQAALAETDPVFDGDDGHAPLLPPVLLVKLVHGGAAVGVVRFALAVVPAAPHVLRVELEFADRDGLTFVHVDFPDLEQKSMLASWSVIRPGGCQDAA